MSSLRYPGAALLLGGAFFVLGACGAPDRMAAGTPTGPSPVVIRGVPFLPQEEETCGPSSLAMLLRFLGRDVSTGEIVSGTRTAGLRGTLITDLAAEARRRGFPAEVEDLDLPRLEETIASGTPVILLVDLGVWVWSRPHFLIAYGFTPQGIVAHSGREEGKVISRAVLDAQWAKMGRLAIVVAPERRP